MVKNETFDKACRKTEDSQQFYFDSSMNKCNFIYNFMFKLIKICRSL